MWTSKFIEKTAASIGYTLLSIIFYESNQLQYVATMFENSVRNIFEVLFDFIEVSSKRLFKKKRRRFSHERIRNCEDLPEAPLYCKIPPLPQLDISFTLRNNDLSLPPDSLDYLLSDLERIKTIDNSLDLDSNDGSYSHLEGSSSSFVQRDDATVDYPYTDLYNSTVADERIVSEDSQMKDVSNKNVLLQMYEFPEVQTQIYTYNMLNGK